MPRDTNKLLYDLRDLTILVVDDQADVRNGLKRLIGTLGCEVLTAASAEQALEVLQNEYFDIIFTDLKMDGMSGVDLMHRVKQQFPEIEVVMITGHGTIEIAVSCLQSGASHFITKPFDNKEILSFIKNAGYKILSRQHAQHNQSKYASRDIVAIDPSMREVMELIEQVAPSKVPVLIEGASGTGKELIAREIHNRSRVSEKPFLAINCIALPDTLLESELFGYKKGAFTGAHKDTKGLFEQVGGGTIFLDEVASMSMMFQGKLLRVLQEKVIRPLGTGETVAVDFRLIAATNKNLEELVADGRFREDLLYRLQVMKIELPKLKDRTACIPALAEHILQRAAREIMDPGETCPSFSRAAIDALIEHNWPGNVRELENTIQRALIVCKGEKIQPSHLGFSKNLNLASDLFDEFDSYENEKQKAIESFQKVYIQKALQRTGGNISRAAELCDLTRAAFQRIMRKLNIESVKSKEKV